MNRTILLILSTFSCALYAMEQPLFNNQFFAFDAQLIQKDLEKLETINWLREKIKPINGGRFFTQQPGPKSNCTLVAEKCAKVLAGWEEPIQVPAKKRRIDAAYRIDDKSNAVVSLEVQRSEQIELVPQQEFIEVINLLEDEDSPTSFIDTTRPLNRDVVKYINASRETIVEQIKSLPGSAASQGKDKTLAGLVYYNYQEVNAGHLANFFRDRQGNVFFVDAQNEQITETPPTKVLNYNVRNEMFFYPLVPQGGYYIKKEFSLKEIKIEDETSNSSISSDENVINFDGTYPCEYCTNKYLYIEGLNRHIELAHTFNFICKYCDNAYSQSGHLYQHIESAHKNIKHYCIPCKKKFTQKSSLNRHIKSVHEGRKYRCEQCPKEFRYQTGLKEHVKLTHNIAKCRCEKCKKNFSNDDNQIIH